MRRITGLVCFFVLAVPSRICAQAADNVTQAGLIQTLLTRIDKLEKRLEEVEKRQKDKAPSTQSEAPTQVIAESATAAHAAHPQVPSAETQPTYPSLKIGGFTDFNFSATDLPGSRSGFNEGQFVLHFTSALSPRVSFFGEASFTARADAGMGNPASAGFNAEIERSIVRFDQSDYFKVSFGRYHTPVNWWNTAFHHGQWLQTTIDRPEMTRFGGQFIPVHFVGTLIEGALPAGGANVNYNFGLGNGRGAVISRGGDAGDVNNNRSWLINVFAKPDSLFGLQAGGSVYRDKIALAGGREFREWISSGHIVWLRETPEVIFEAANVNHREVGGNLSFNSQAVYIQVAYRLPQFQQLFKPYYRFEYIDVSNADPVFRLLSGLNGSIVGVRYDLSSFAAFKTEYRHQRRTGQPRVNGGFMQISFTF